MLTDQHFLGIELLNKCYDRRQVSISTMNKNISPFLSLLRQKIMLHFLALFSIPVPHCAKFGQNKKQYCWFESGDVLGSSICDISNQLCCLEQAVPRDLSVSSSGKDRNHVHSEWFTVRRKCDYYFRGVFSCFCFVFVSSTQVKII